MEFVTEPPGYDKTVVSDLQGAWETLRNSLANSEGFPGADRALFHIDEAMSWETVRNLERMPPLLLLVRNLCIQGGAPAQVLGDLEYVSELVGTVEAMRKEGKIL